jgi:hypothetical protein
MTPVPFHHLEGAAKGGGNRVAVRLKPLALEG